MSTSDMEPPGVSLTLDARRGMELIVVMRGMGRGDGGGEKSFIVRRVDDEI